MSELDDLGIRDDDFGSLMNAETAELARDALGEEAYRGRLRLGPGGSDRGRVGVDVALLCSGGAVDEHAGYYRRRAMKPYRASRWRRMLNAVVRPLARLGLAGPRTVVLTVPGRRSGKLWSTPVSLVRRGEERWLVAPYGDRNWVLNARAAGWVELRRGRRRERLGVRELDAASALQPSLQERCQEKRHRVSFSEKRHPMSFFAPAPLFAA